MVDDGIATGLTTLATIKYLKKHKVKKIILAVPVASNEALDKIKSEVAFQNEQPRKIQIRI